MGDLFLVLSCLPPLGAGLGNPAIHAFAAQDLSFSSLFLFSSCRSTPPVRSWGRSGQIGYTCGIGLRDFVGSLFRRSNFASLALARVVELLQLLLQKFVLSRFHRHILTPLPPVAGVIDRAVVFVYGLSLSLADRPPLFPITCLGVHCRLRSLAVQRCGDGV